MDFTFSITRIFYLLTDEATQKKLETGQPGTKAVVESKFQSLDTKHCYVGACGGSKPIT